MNVMLKIVSNGFIPVIPILLWNVLFASKLPPAFGPDSFDENIPRLILIFENLFRSVVFILPLVLRIDIGTQSGRHGLIVYIIGSLLYYLSWLMLMYFPGSMWSTSAIGFAAPAYTPIIWFTGLSMMAGSYYFNFTYSKWHLIVPCCIFSAFHITHTLLAFLRNGAR